MMAGVCRVSSKSNLVVAEARTWIGTPYRHQQSAKGAGTDCLGLIRGIWRAIYGAEPEAIPAYSPDWSETRGEELLWRAALRHMRPGDRQDDGQVLLFRMRNGSVAKHLGISAGTNGHKTFIHAYSGHGVLESPLSDPWVRRIVARFDFP